MRNPELQYFLVVAEERNITRAAQRLLLSQQSLSAYLQRLEQHYGVQLFMRKPSLRLTYAGECLYKTAKQIKSINEKLFMTFEEIKNDRKGRIVLGIPRPRSNVIIPDLLPLFKNSYPDVELVLIEEHTAKLAEMAVAGTIDIFIGFEPITNPKLVSFPLLHDELYLLVPDQILEQYFKGIYPECINKFKNGADLASFQHMPFIVNEQGSTVRTQIDKYFAQIGANINIVFESASSDMTTELCLKNIGVGICLKMQLKRTMLKIKQFQKNNVHIFPINTLMEGNTVVLAYCANKAVTSYLKRLIDDIHLIFEQYKK